MKFIVLALAFVAAASAAPIFPYFGYGAGFGYTSYAAPAIATAYTAPAFTAYAAPAITSYTAPIVHSAVAPVVTPAVSVATPIVKSAIYTAPVHTVVDTFAAPAIAIDAWKKRA